LALGLGFLGGLLSDAVSTITSAMGVIGSYLTAFFSQVQQIITFMYTIISNYVSLIVSTFPFDNPRKTLMLSIIFFVLIFGFIIFTSKTDFYREGVSGVNKNVEYEVMNFGGTPGGISGGGVQGTVTTTIPIPVNPNPAVCITDYDCTVERTGIEGGTKCCYADQYVGFSCAGQCQRFSNIDRDDCRHPGACLRNVDAFAETVDDPGICINKYGQDIGGGLVPRYNTYCQEKWSQGAGVNSKSLCCQNIGEICYGYCLNGATYDCNDPDACEKENTISVEPVEAMDI